MRTRKVYTKELYRQFGYFATWLPGVPLELGDIGVFRRNEFTKIGNLSNEGISFEIEKDTSASDLEYVSSQGVSVSTKLSGAASPTGSFLTEADAGISVQFTKENAILFKAMDVLFPAIKDQIALGEEVLKRFRNGQWNKDWAIITELAEAKSASILISSSKEAQIDIKANAQGGTDNLDIADASFDFQAKFTKDLSTKIIAQEGLTPLFKVSKVKPRLFGTSIFKARGVLKMDTITPHQVKKLPKTVIFGEADFEIVED